MPNRLGFIGLDVIIFAGVLIGSIVIGVTTVQNRNSVADTRSQAACASNEIFCGGCINGCRRNTQTCNRWIDQECNTSTECAGNGVSYGNRECCPGLIKCTKNGRCGTTCEAPSTPVPTQRAVCNATLRNECAQDNKVCVIEDNKPKCVTPIPTPFPTAREFETMPVPTLRNCPNSYRCMELSDIEDFRLQAFNQYNPCPSGQQCARARAVASPTVTQQQQELNERIQVAESCFKTNRCVSVTNPARCIALGSQDSQNGRLVECYSDGKNYLWRYVIKSTPSSTAILTGTSTPTPTNTPVIIPRASTPTPTNTPTNTPRREALARAMPTVHIQTPIPMSDTSEVIINPTRIPQVPNTKCSNSFTTVDGCKNQNIGIPFTYNNMCIVCTDGNGDKVCGRQIVRYSPCENPTPTAAPERDTSVVNNDDSSRLNNINSTPTPEEQINTVTSVFSRIQMGLSAIFKIFTNPLPQCTGEQLQTMPNGPRRGWVRCLKNNQELYMCPEGLFIDQSDFSCVRAGFMPNCKSEIGLFNKINPFGNNLTNVHRCVWNRGIYYECDDGFINNRYSCVSVNSM